MLGRRKLSEGAVNNSTQLSTIFWIQGFCLLLVVFFLTLETASLNPAKPITNKLRGKLQLCLDFGVSPWMYFLHWMKRKKKSPSEQAGLASSLCPPPSKFHWWEFCGGRPNIQQSFFTSRTDEKYYFERTIHDLRKLGWIKHLKKPPVYPSAYSPTDRLA